MAGSNLPAVILGLQRSAGNRTTRAAVPRLQGQVQTLQRRVRLPAGGGKPDRVASTQGRIVVANRDTLYADARLIQQSQEALAARRSFVKLTAGPECPFERGLWRVNVGPADELKWASEAALAGIYYAANQPNPLKRVRARQEYTTNPELAESFATPMDFQSDIAAKVGDYATFCDCHNNTMLVLGAEGNVEGAIYRGGGALEIVSLEQRAAETFQGSPVKMTSGRKIDDPATRGAYAWLAKAIPSFASVLRRTISTALSGRKGDVDPSAIARLMQIKSSIEASIVSRISINDPATAATALANPEYPRALWELYRKIQDDAVAAKLLASTYKMNQQMAVRTGDAIAIINDPFEKAESDAEIVAEEAHPTGRHVQTKWNYHWIPVIMTDGDDYAVLENAAGSAPSMTAMDTYRWKFRIFGPEEHVYGVNAPANEPETTSHYMTLAFDKPHSPDWFGKSRTIDAVRAPNMASGPTAFAIRGLVRTKRIRAADFPAARDDMIAGLLGRKENKSAERPEVEAYVDWLIAEEERNAPAGGLLPPPGLAAGPPPPPGVAGPPPPPNVLIH